MVFGGNISDRHGWKIDKLCLWLNQNDVKIAALQETKLNKKGKPINIPNYTLINQYRQRDSGGGVAFLIHESINFEELPLHQLDEQLEHISIKVGDITIVNIYIPPASSCSAGFTPSILPLLPSGDSIITGDFNAHDPLWHSTMLDTRGMDLAEEINTSSHGVLNSETPTRLPSTQGSRPSSPDISLASLSLLPYLTWSTTTSMGSDHLPILINCSTNIKPQPSEKRTFINFKKADWPGFSEYTESKFSAVTTPTDVYKAERCFRAIINAASKMFIPHGRIKEVVPEVPTEAREKMNLRDNLRSTNPTSPQIAELNQEIKKTIIEHKREKWREKISSLGTKTDTGKLYKLIKSINGQPPMKSNQGIRFKNKYLTSAKDLANAFNIQYTSIVRHKSNKETRRISKQAKKFSLETPPVFSDLETLKAIKRSKASKAVGPDGISNLHLKHLGPAGIAYLTKIFNLSAATAKIPQIWKNSIVVPLLKPGKAAELSNSYRPVSLLCPSIKIFERLLLPTLQECLEIPDHQHGFRAQRSTVTALDVLNQDITAGFNQPKPMHRTILLQLDMSKAFDMVNLSKLQQDLNTSPLPPAIKRWMNTYLRGRQSRVNFRNKTSNSRNVKTGVPQGAVTSPILFNYYLSKMPTPPSNIKLIQYADDISIYATGPVIGDLCKAINSYTEDVVAYLESRELQLSAEKSTVTLFTNDNSQFNIAPDIFVKNQKVVLEKEPKILGVYFNTMHTYSTHISKTVDKAKKRINVLKALAGTDWGQSKEIITNTYKAIGRSILEYDSPIWSPSIKETHWQRLQRVQNSAPRIATGCFTMASEEHIHRETKVLPLREHGKMITQQYLAACHLPGHPGRDQLTRPPSRRKLKTTHLDYLDDVQDFFVNNTDDSTYKSAIKSIHCTTVTRTVNSYPVNKVLNEPPPTISNEETELPRKTRSILSQLRSGFSKLLNSYNHRINPDTPDSCPLCSQSPHDTLHLFNCSSNPTHLSAIDLWTNPIEVATFLGLDDGHVEPTEPE